MAINAATPFGKIITTGMSNDGKIVNETLGYTDINVFDANQATNIENLIGFAVKVQSQLTDNTYTKSTVTYEVSLDNLEG